MPGKLIAFIVALLIIVTFIGLNIENSSDIRIWFGENGLLEDVPIFVSFFVMYLIGVLSVIPFIMSWRLRKSKKTSDTEFPSESSTQQEKKVRVLGKKRGKATTPEQTAGAQTKASGKGTENEASAGEAEDGQEEK